MTERKAKRRLSGFDFSQTGAHIALVHKEQGGPANEVPTLIMKSMQNFSEDFIQKMQQVRVTMELDDFLETFFHLWEDEASVLAAMMGYKEESEGEGKPSGVYHDESFYCWYEDKMKANGYEGEYWNMPEPTDADHQEWIAMRLEGIEIIKSMKESDSLPEFISKLSEADYLKVLRDQERFEKALAKKDSVIAEIAKAKEAKQPVVAEPKKPKARVVKKAKVSEQGHKAEPVNKAGIDAKADKAEPKKTEVSKMTVKTVEVEKTEQVEMVEKSQYESIAKALEDQRIELEKASALIAQFQEEKKVAVAKARKAELVAAVSEEDKAEQLFKAVGELADEAFQAVVEVVKALSAKVEADPMFVEKGAATEEATAEQDELTALLKARYKK